MDPSRPTMIPVMKRKLFWHLTLKDILTILCAAAVPIALALYTSITNRQTQQQAEEARKFDQQQSLQTRQQILYDTFLNNIYKLDNDGHLKNDKDPWAFANAFYRASHRQWDSVRKGDILQFLKEKQLIGRNNNSAFCQKKTMPDIIRLNQLNFDHVRLISQTGTSNGVNLEWAVFDQVSMSNATFSFVNLNGASFEGGRLDNTKFSDTSLICATFNGVSLNGVDFSNSILRNATFLNVDLSNVKMTDEQIKQANFYNTTMPNGEHKTATPPKAAAPRSLSSFVLTSTQAARSPPFSLVVADFNKDNKIDLMVAVDDYIELFLGNGTGHFNKTAEMSCKGYDIYIAAGDLDNDTNLDLVAFSNYNQTMEVFYGSGNGTFVQGYHNSFKSMPFHFFDSTRDPVAIDDFNGDKKLDFAVLSQLNNTVTLYLASDNRNFTIKESFGIGESPFAIVSGKFNDDIYADLAVANHGNSYISILLGRADGSLANATDYLIGGDLSAISVGRFNSDNYIDLVVASFDSRTISILFGNEDGTFRQTNTFATPSHPYAIDVADMNQDGVHDLIVNFWNDSNDTIDVFLGRSDETFDVSMTIITIANDLRDMAIGDFNGDARPDIVASHYNNQSLSVFLNLGP